MKQRSATLIDNEGQEFLVEDIVIFRKHIKDFHLTGVSVHDEKGHLITVDDTFRDKIEQLFTTVDG